MKNMNSYLKFGLLVLIILIIFLPRIVWQRTPEQSIAEQGTIAPDFKFITHRRDTSALHEIESEYTLLFFYKAEDPSFSDIINYMDESTVFKAYQADNSLTILACCPSQNSDSWENNNSILPQDWVNAYTAASDVQKRYFSRFEALPIFYLLDRQKKVILTDSDYSQIELRLRIGSTDS